MANLRDIKTRIQSVKTTRQVTSAMKMVSAARLKKAQDDISHIRPFTSRLAGIIQDLSAQEDVAAFSPYTQATATGDKVLILALASNRGLCGAFNTNVVKEVQVLLQEKYRDAFRAGKVQLAVMGKQAEKQFRSRGMLPDFCYHELLGQADYQQFSGLADQLMHSFEHGELKQVVLVYNEFVNAAVQNVQVHQFLPFKVPEHSQNLNPEEYLLEPDASGIINLLVPNMLRSMLFQVALESLASEHGARMTSMHKATDNATDLIRDLELSYNKARQAAITNQIVEISGGAEALNKS